MIAQYNRAQVMQAALAAVGGIISFILAYLFFRYGFAFATNSLGYPLSPLASNLLALVGLSAVCLSGYRTWTAKGGLLSYHESAFYHDLDIVSGGTSAVDLYAHRVTAPAHILSQMFLAGPLLLLRAWTLLSSLIEDSPELEQRLAETLAVLRNANKWQSLTEYPTRKSEILYLAQMRLIDFSAHKGTPRIKAERSSGN